MLHLTRKVKKIRNQYSSEDDRMSLQWKVSMKKVDFKQGMELFGISDLDFMSWKHLLLTRRRRIDKYLDTVLADQTAQKALPLIIPKVAVARWWTAQVFISLILSNWSLRRRSSAIANYVSYAVCRIAKCSMRDQRPSCNYHHGCGFGFLYLTNQLYHVIEWNPSFRWLDIRHI